MTVQLKPFPLSITSAQLEDMQSEVRRKIQKDVVAEFGNLPRAQLAELVQNEFGMGFFPKSYGRITADQVRDFYIAALMLAEPYRPASDAHALLEVRTWLQDAGRTLDAAGGLELMQEAFYAVKMLLNHAIPLSRAWDGIGDWRH